MKMSFSQIASASAICSLCLVAPLGLSGCDSATPGTGGASTANTEASHTADVSQPGPASTEVPKPTMTLYEATLERNIEQVKANIAHGADLNAYTADGPRGGFTALHAASRANYLEIVALLIEAGADVNIRADAPHGATPLHWAIRSGNADVVRMLVEAGCDVNARFYTDEQPTPMSFAVGRREYEIAEYLANHGAKM